MVKRTRTAGPEQVSPTGITWSALKCRLGAGLTPYEIGACIGRRERDVLQAMKDYDLHKYKPPKKKQTLFEMVTMPDGRVVSRHYKMPEETAVAIYESIISGNTLHRTAKITGANQQTVYNFITRNKL